MSVSRSLLFRTSVSFKLNLTRIFSFGRSVRSGFGTLFGVLFSGLRRL